MGRAEEFALPPDAAAFVENVYYRATELIRARIWEGLTQTRLRKWQTNFPTATESYFSACVLDALIYRSAAQTEALARHLWFSALPRELSADSSLPRSLASDLESLFARKRQRSVYVVPVVQHDELGKSGHVIARLLEKHLRIDPSAMTLADKLPRSAGSTVLFVDDFLGTGTQFFKFVRHYHLQDLLRSSFCAYLPLVAHSSGTRLLAKLFPTLRVIAAEHLTSAHSLFSTASVAFADGINSPTGARRFYRSFRLSRGIPAGWYRRGGSGHLSTSYAFQHAIPNNNIEILWTRQPGSWEPLFDR